jgi:hypothetical protein
VLCIGGCVFVMIYCAYILVVSGLERSSCLTYNVPYCKGQSKHFSLYTSLLSYLLLFRRFRCNCFCVVFAVFKANFVLVSLNIFVICLVSCPKNVNVIDLFCSRMFVLE